MAVNKGINAQKNGLNAKEEFCFNGKEIPDLPISYYPWFRIKLNIQRQRTRIVLMLSE
jgi:hypothetical protein